MRLARIVSDGREGIALAEGDGARALFGTDAGYPGGLSELVSGGSQALQRGAEVLAKAEPVDLESVCTSRCLARRSRSSAWVSTTAATRGRPIMMCRPTPPYSRGSRPVSPGTRPRLSAPGCLSSSTTRANLSRLSERAAATSQRVTPWSTSSATRSSTMDRCATSRWRLRSGPSARTSTAPGPSGRFSSRRTRFQAGGSGLQLTTRLNGQIVQQADTSEMIYGVASVIAFLSEAMTFHPGDVLAMGTPLGVGLERDPQLLVKGRRRM